MADFRQPGLITRIAVPLRHTAQRFAFASLVIAAFGLMLLANGGAVFVERMRVAVADVSAPIIGVMARPVAAVNDLAGNIRELVDLRAENQRLRAEVARLQSWYGAAHRLAAENRSLRELAAYRGPQRRSFTTARVVADGRGPFVKSVLVNAGRQQSLAKGQAAITPYGLVGRVSETGNRSARILLMTDLNSRIPVVLEDTRTRAILAGDNSDHPVLAFLPENAAISIGQRIVTSGHGGGLPPGIAVGRIDRISDGAVRVAPFSDLNRLEYLQIVAFESVQPPAPAVGENAKPAGKGDVITAERANGS